MITYRPTCIWDDISRFSMHIRTFSQLITWLYNMNRTKLAHTNKTKNIVIIDDYGLWGTVHNLLPYYDQPTAQLGRLSLSLTTYK